ncbi:MAG: metallophosphoesterase family protein [candidate division WOR-3 bacterium]
MKVGVISDIHGNWEALKAVVEEGNNLKVEKWWCLGDVVGYYPQITECITWVKKNCEIVVRGNHDFEATRTEPVNHFNPMAEEAILWTRKNLKPEEKQFLEKLPLVVNVNGISLSHSNPFYPDSWIYVFDSFDIFCLLLESKNIKIANINFFGHTHIPGIFAYDGEKVTELEFPQTIRDDIIYFVNPGSVGQPRDGVNMASFITYHIESKTIELHRVKYDFRYVQRLVIEKKLPQYLAQRLEKGI